MNSEAMDYDLCGWRVTSAIAVPHLAPWRGDPRVPDITIEIGDVPPLVSAASVSPMVSIDSAGRVRFRATGVADYLIDGRRIVISPIVPADSPEICLFLLGSGLGYLCHQRGVFPIHGASVVIDGRAVVLAGPSGAGKSTLADAFSRRGYAILSDDVSPIALSADQAMVLPGLRRIRLWKDALDNAGWDADALVRCRPSIEKFSRPLQADGSVAAAPAGAIFRLRRQWDKMDGFRIRQVSGRDAVEEVRQQTYRWRSLVTMIGQTDAAVRSIAAAGAFPYHFILDRAVQFDRLDETVDGIVGKVRSLW